MKKYTLNLLAAIVLLGFSYVTHAVVATSETSTNTSTGDKTYTKTYPLTAQRGIVKIDDYSKPWRNNGGLYPEVLYPSNCQEIKVTITRHKSNQVIIQAVLKKDLAALVDESEDASKRRSWHALHKPNNFYKEQGMIWVPWNDDAVLKSIEEWLRPKSNVDIRGNNRLTLTLNQPGHYHITIPYDADLDTTLSQGDITYKTASVPTYLHTDSNTVNQWGDSGSSGDGRNSWTYYWGTKSDPITSLKTDKGHIDLHR